MSARILLAGAMFLSGAAALLYETLFFRLVARALGNSTVAAAVVLAAFMGGLSLGSFLAGRRGGALSNPVRGYQWLEGTIALSGLGLVSLLPSMQAVLAPIFATLPGPGAPVTLARAAAALLLMGVPATAMGATLPVLAEGAHRGDARFGSVFGSMYAWNTLGAVGGALAAELALIPGIGLTGTGLVAASMNCCSVALAAPVASGWRAGRSSADVTSGGVFGSRALIVVGGAIAGFCFLALEVVWLRYLQLFVFGSSLNFAIMLGVVLAGMGLGALASSAVLRSHEGSGFFAAMLLCACGLAVPIGYRLFSAAVPLAAPAGDTLYLLTLSTALMLPAALCSGALFPVFGQMLQRRTGGAARPAGWLTTANTAGAAVGAAVGAFVLLPGLGMERSMLALALLYGAAAFLPLVAEARGSGSRPARPKSCAVLAAPLACVALAVAFPAGAVQQLLDLSVENFLHGNGERRVALVETPRETVQYLRKDLLGEPYYHRLVTNNYSMSTTMLWARRYMRLFAAVPLALRPDAEDALLICYGCGTTARALTEASGLRRIDIVDVSREIVELGRLVHPDERRNPTRDARVTVHIEDGRFFLMTTGRTYDIITGEPPPPKAGHVVDLYTREYFKLMASRLKDGGVASYWLPVHQLTADDARSIVRAFADAFDGTSLWLGDGGNWILVGTKGTPPPPGEKGLSRQWQDPVSAGELRAIGLSSPTELGALYIAGGERLRAWVGSAAPLTDDRPGRLSRGPGRDADREEYGRLLDPKSSWNEFSDGEGTAGLWPEPLRRQALPWFRLRPLIDRAMYLDAQALAACLENPLLREQLLWVFGSDAIGQRILAAAEQKGWSGDQAEDRLLLHLAARAARNAEPAAARAFLARALAGPLLLRDKEARRKVIAMQEVLAGHEARRSAR